MNDSDRQYFSRFALDPATEYSWEDLYGFDFSCSDNDGMDAFDDGNILDSEDPIPEENLLFKN